MTADVATALLVVALVVLPGYALTRVAVPGSGRFVALAASVPVGLGLVYVLAVWFTRTGVPVESATLAPVLVAVVAWGAWVELQRPRPVRPGLQVAVTLGAVPLTLLPWLIAYRLPVARPVNDDGLNHAIFTTLIARARSIAPRDVLLIDLPSHESATSYYPLAVHTVAALPVQLGVTDGGRSFLLASLLLGALALPLGVFLLTRRLFPSVPWAAPAAAVLAAVCTELPGVPMQFALYLVVVGIALVGATVELLIGAGASRRALVPAVAAVVGVAGTHTSEVVLVGVIVVALLLWPWPGSRRLVRSLRPLAVVGGAALVLLAPTLRDLVRGSDQRFDQAVVPHPTYPTAIVRAVLLGAESDVVGITIAVLALLGAAVALRRRFALGWLGLLVVAALAYGTGWYLRPRAVLLLTSPWYSEPRRLAFNLAFLSLPLAAFGFVVLLDRVRASAPDPRAGRAAAIGVGCVLGLLVPIGTATSASLVRTGVTTSCSVKPADAAAFAYLDAHVRPGERVLNTRADCTGWMTVLGDAAPLTGVRVEDVWNSPAWAGRWAAVRGIGRPDDPRVAALLKRWDVRYVVVGATTYAKADSGGLGKWDVRLDPTVLDRAPGLRQVFRDGDVRVYEVSR